jgi:hypothetical protein
MITVGAKVEFTDPNLTHRSMWFGKKKDEKESLNELLISGWLQSYL